MSDPAHDHTEDDVHVHVHVHPTKFYLGVLLALLSLTVATVLTAKYADLDGLLSLGHPNSGGGWNLGLAMIIATTKATLVCLFFMHLREDKRFNALFFVGSVLFVGIFFAYTLNDTDTRGQMGDIYNGVRIDPERGTRAPGGVDYVIRGEGRPVGLDHRLVKSTLTKPAPVVEAEAPVVEEPLGDDLGLQTPVDPNLAPEVGEAVVDEQQRLDAEAPPPADEAPVVAPERAPVTADGRRVARPTLQAQQARGGNPPVVAQPPANAPMPRVADPEEESSPGD